MLVISVMCHYFVRRYLSLAHSGQPLLHEALVSSCQSWLSGCSGTAKNSLGSSLGDLSFTRALTQRFTLPEGHGLGAPACGLERGSLARKQTEGREKEQHRRKNAREGTCLAPSRGTQERGNTGELKSGIAANGDGTKSARNARSKLRLREGEPTMESK